MGICGTHLGPISQEVLKISICKMTFKNHCKITSTSLSGQWSWVTHICIVKLTIIGSDNGLSPGRRRAIIWTNAGILLIGPLGTNFIEILIGIQTFSFKKMHLKMSSAKTTSILSRPQWVKNVDKHHLLCLMTETHWHKCFSRFNQKENLLSYHILL